MKSLNGVKKRRNIARKNFLSTHKINNYWVREPMNGGAGVARGAGPRGSARFESILAREVER